MSNKEIAEIFRHVAVAYILKNEAKYRFQIIAYQKAADSIEAQVVNLKNLWSEGKLYEISGIGRTIKAYIDELFTKGKVAHFETLFKEIPGPVFKLLKIPGIGAKKASSLVSNLHLEKSKNILSDLKKSAHGHKISIIPGFGDKSEAEISKNIALFEKGTSKINGITLPIAFKIASDVITYLKALSQVLQIEPLGSLRRMKETVRDIDIAVASNDPRTILDYFIKYPYAERVLEKGEATASIVTFEGAQIDLMIQPPQAFGALLQHFTGSKSHNIKLREYALKQGLSLSEYGIKILNKSQEIRIKKYGGKYNPKVYLYQIENEKNFYQALGLPWIPPELREDRGEIEAAIRQSQGIMSGSLPKLIEFSAIKGDLHVHSNFNVESSHDLGTHNMEDMVKKAQVLGYDYLAFSEHSPSVSKHNQKQICEILKRKREKIDKLNYSWKQNSETRVIKVFNSLELDILANGDRSVEEGLKYLDFAIASIHSSFHQSKDEITNRILSALEHPKIKILGHPTGRILGERDGYDLDWEKIFDFCLKNNKALEINAYPTRLDLPDSLVYEAKKYGVKMVVDTDSHTLDQMDLMFYGISVARRGWLEKDDIINTLSLEKFIKWIIK